MHECRVGDDRVEGVVGNPVQEASKGRGSGIWVQRLGFSGGGSGSQAFI